MVDDTALFPFHQSPVRSLAEREKATESVVNWSSVRSVVLVMGSTFDVPRVFALLSWVSCGDEDDNNNSIMLRDD